MIFRTAQIEDIPQIQTVRNSVFENRLSDPGLVTDEACAEFITARGKGWVCEFKRELVGFSIVDMKESNVWALFVKPDFEHKGIGKHLHKLMLNWYFKQTQHTLWLNTAPNTRAIAFYKKAGWNEVGMHGSSEIKFEMNFNSWLINQSNI